MKPSRRELVDLLRMAQGNMMELAAHLAADTPPAVIDRHNEVTKAVGEALQRLEALH